MTLLTRPEIKEFAARVVAGDTQALGAYKLMRKAVPLVAVETDLLRLDLINLCVLTEIRAALTPTDT